MSQFKNAVTDVKVYPIEGMGNLKANVSITLFDEFVLGGLRLIEGSNGLFVSMPSYKNKDGEYKDISFPLSKDVRTDIQTIVIEAYNRV